MTPNPYGDARQVNVVPQKLVNWTSRPDTYWVDEDWSGLSGVLKWCERHQIEVSPSPLSRYLEFRVVDDLLRVELALKFNEEQ